MTREHTHKVVEGVWRIESARIIAVLARMVRDVGVAEELAQDAMVAALEQWPAQGIPDNPGAWLMTTAKRRAIDRFRAAEVHERKHGEVARELEMKQEWAVADFQDAVEKNVDGEIEDDLLRLIFTACHPVLTTEARVALTLRLLGGLRTDEIARAFLAPEATIAQRIVRAKRALAEAKVPFEIPRGEDLTARLASVLEVIYLIFNEGYSATAGSDWMRPALCEEALRLGRILAELAPGEAEVHGLVALMEIQASRIRARTRVDGEPILLLEQDRGRWDQLLIRRGLTALERAPAARLSASAGMYELQAEIAACHARARTAEETDWKKIADFYGELNAVMRSPVVELNRAVAVGFAEGPAAGLEIVDALVASGELDGYHLLASVRGDLLERLGRVGEAREEFGRAAGMAKNEKEKEMMLERGRRIGSGGEK